MKYICLNPSYVLKPDNGKVLMLAALQGRNLLKGIEDSFTNIIHPIYAMILSFIDGRLYEECINEAAQQLGVEEKLVANFVDSLLDVSNSVTLHGKDGLSSFPPYSIISSNVALGTNKRYYAEMFEFSKVNLLMERHLTPSTITLMFNNICITDCIYCYQDKSRKMSCSIPLERINELIDEAYSLHVNTFDVIGGEFFLYKYWREVLVKLRGYGYNPYLSTKMPMSEENIKFLAELKIHDIQVSIDSLIESHLIPSLHVKKGYVNQMLRTLRLLEKYNIPVMIHSVLTKHTNSVEDMKSIYDVISDFTNIVDWHVVKGEETLYPKTAYKNIEIKDDDLNQIVAYLDRMKLESKISIHAPQAIVSTTEQFGSQNGNTDFFNRSFCSGLYSSLYILPDGQVTICEQLYWNERFIIGNVLDNSIEEIWNSEKAKSLYYIKQSDIPEDSLCHTCSAFGECRSLRQVCYREIIKKYGKSHWYYPDVKCPYN